MPTPRPSFKTKRIINLGLVIFLTLATGFLFLKTPSAQASIIVNEIMYDLSGADDKHEWVELYNPDTADVDLTDWKFNDGSNHKLNPPAADNGGRGSLILPTDGYLLLADDADTLASDLPNYQGTIIDTVMDLNNTGDTLKILNADGQEITAVVYNKEMGAAGNGKTLGWDGTTLKESLTDGGTPGMTNSVLSGSASPATPTPTSSASPTSTPAPSLTPSKNFQYSQNILINEFLPYPEKDQKEWVELINNDASAVDLAGWQIDDDDNSTSPQAIPENTIIKPGEFLVISFNKSTLNNDGDKIRLLWPDDQIVHAVAFNKASQGQAVAKFNTGWLWTNQPTPGQTNKKSSSTDTSSVNVALAAAEKINPIEESVSVENKTANPSYATPKTTPSSPPSPTAQTLTPNLVVSVSSSVKENSGLKTILALSAILLLAILSAGGLIYFRRKIQVDSPSPDD